MAETARIAETVDDEGRVLFADDPAVGLGSIVTGLTESGELMTDDLTEQLPVALFEPRRAQMVHDVRTGKDDEIQV